MSNLTNRRAKVERLRRQAISDRMPHKYMQASSILKDIDSRMTGNENFRTQFLNQLRK